MFENSKQAKIKKPKLTNTERNKQAKYKLIKREAKKNGIRKKEEKPHQNKIFTLRIVGSRKILVDYKI